MNENGSTQQHSLLVIVLGFGDDESADRRAKAAIQHIQEAAQLHIGIGEQEFSGKSCSELRGMMANNPEAPLMRSCCCVFAMFSVSLDHK